MGLRVSSRRFSRNRFRADGQALGSFTHWVFAVPLIPLFTIGIGLLAAGYLILFFAGMMMLQLGWVRFFGPEANGVLFEEMQKRLGIDE